MEINYEELRKLSMGDLCAIKDKAGIHLSLVSIKENNKSDVDYWTSVMSACIAEMGNRMNIIFVQ